MNGLLSMNQLLGLIRRKLQRHESVIQSGLQSSTAVSSSPVNVTMVSRDDTCSGSWDISTLSTHTHYGAGNALIMLVNVCEKNDELKYLMDLPTMGITATDEMLPKVVFIQYFLKSESFNFESVKQEMKVKPFILPTDCSICFMCTTRNMRQMISKYLTSPSCLMIQQRLSQLRQRLATEQDVIYVSPVYSSLGRRLTCSLSSDVGNMRPSPPPCLRLNPEVGSALIICISADRSRDCDSKGIFKPHWREEFDNAEYILGRQLGLTVESRNDMSSEEIIHEVRSFAWRTRGDNYSVVAIMADGDENDQIVTRDNTVLSVHELVDVFSDYCDNPKMVILQYCRGPNVYSKLPGTHEHKFLNTVIRRRPKLEKCVELSPKQKIIPPRNTFMVYSTSSDSRSERGLLFKCMKMELYGTWKYKPRPKTVDVVEMMTDVAGSVRDKTLLYQHVETVDTLCEPLYLHLYPYEEPDADEQFCDMLD